MLDPSLIEEAIPPGSPLQYALVFAQPGQRRLLGLLHALNHQLLRAAAAGESEVASVKVGWWREEIRALVAGTPRHPLTVELGRLAEWDETDLEYLYQTTVAAEDAQRRRFCSDDEDLTLYCFRSAGCLYALCSRKLAPEDTHDEPAVSAARIGRGIRLVEIVRDLPLQARTGFTPLPLAMLERCGLEPAGLATAAARLPALEPVLQDQLAQADSLLGAACNDLTGVQRQDLLWLVILAEHHRVLASKIARSIASIWSQRIALGPFASLWQAWRAARRVRRRFHAQATEMR